MNYIKTAVIVLIISMILSLVLTYASILTIVETSKVNTERVLNSFVIENSTYVFNSIKNGNDFTSSIDAVYFVSKYLADGTLDFDGSSLYNKNRKDGYVYRLSIPQIIFTQTNTLNLTCTYNLMIPFEFAGKRFTELIIPIKVKTSFNIMN
jgi:hypothetical protein